VVLALAAIRPVSAARSGPQKALVAELRGGLSYVRGHRLMLTLVLLVVVSTFLAMPILTLLPTFAYRVLEGAGGAPETRLSTLMALQGLGAITGALIIGSVGRFKHMGMGLLAIQLLMGLLIAAFGMSSVPAISYALIFFCGITFMGLFSMSFSIVQLAVPEELRGRVVSIYMVALRGGGPLGGLAAGALADLWSAPVVMTVNGLLLAVVTVGIYLSGRGRSLREI
jgi:predicted MFS family arabinose efflux permease